ncbi:MAG TPA: hypothetical protein DCQ64_23820 [Candidatus Rokubacteria bacterium]|nr:hypothetical protein [Candidatus Rokubacteria bacterium]
MNDVINDGQCGICGEGGEVFYLPIYPVGSEGVVVCLQCRIDLTEVVRAMMRVGGKQRLLGFLSARRGVVSLPLPSGPLPPPSPDIMPPLGREAHDA